MITFILLPLPWLPEYLVKAIWGECTLIITHSLIIFHGLLHTTKSHKNCTILSLKRIFQSERWPLWEGSLKSQCLGPPARAGCMTLWFRRSWPKRCGRHDESEAKDCISQGTQNTIPEVGVRYPSAELVTPENFNGSNMKTGLAPPISKASVPIPFALMVCKIGLKYDL